MVFKGKIWKGSQKEGKPAGCRGSKARPPGGEWTGGFRGWREASQP